MLSKKLRERLKKQSKRLSSCEQEKIEIVEEKQSSEVSVVLEKEGEQHLLLKLKRQKVLCCDASKEQLFLLTTKGYYFFIELKQKKAREKLSNKLAFFEQEKVRACSLIAKNKEIAFVLTHSYLYLINGSRTAMIAVNRFAILKAQPIRKGEVKINDRAYYFIEWENGKALVFDESFSFDILTIEEFSSVEVEDRME